MSIATIRFVRPAPPARPLLALALALAGAPACAAPLALDEAVASALAAAPEVTRAVALQAAASERAASAAQRADPELLLALENVPVEGEDAGSLSADLMTMRKVGLMQRFDGAGSRDAAQAAADAAVALREASTAVQRAAVARAAAQAWFEWALESARLELLQAQRHRYELHVAAADARVAAGGGTLEALAARRELAEFEARLDGARGRHAGAAAMLARWVGGGIEGGPAALPAIDALPPGLEQAGTDALPEVIEGQRRLEQAGALAERARLERRPGWTLEASYADRGPAYDDMVSVGVRIDLPWRASQRQDREYAARLAERDAAQAQLELRRRQRVAEIAALCAQWQAAGTRVERYRGSIEPLARDAADAALAAYRGGTSSLGEALAATHAAERAGLETLDALAEQASAWAALRYLLPES